MTRYLAVMRNAAVKLATLVALLFMPLGMSAAASAPSTAAHGHQAMAMKHCADEQQQPRHHDEMGFATCTMVCASALPAGELARPAEPIMAAQPELALATDRLRGVLPEIATPPPRIS